MVLYHYYDKSRRPFMNLSDVSIEKAKDILNRIKADKPNTQSAKRQESYVDDRLFYEQILRYEFEKQGGVIKRRVPHYMVVEPCEWLSTWFDNCDFIRIDIKEFDLRTVSFTYGDSHPTFSYRVNDGKEYRKKLYIYDEIVKIIEKYGLPQDWNKDGKYGPERYVEAHIWDDETIDKYIK